MVTNGGHARGVDLARARSESEARKAGPTSPNQPLHVLVALFSIVLVTAPALHGGAALRLGTLVPFFLCIAWSLPRQERGRAGALGVAVLVLYILIVAVGLVRGAAAGSYFSIAHALGDAVTIATVAAFAVTLVTSARSEAELRSRVIAVALSPTVYVAINIVLLHLVGPPHVFIVGEDVPAQVLGLLGINTTRVLFPLSGGFNAFGAVAAAGLAASVVLWRQGSLHWRLAIPTSAVCLYGLLATDSRGPLLVASGVVLAFLLAPRIRAAGGIAAVIIASPIIVVTGLGLLANSELVGALSRSGNDLVTAGGRVQIWTTVLEMLRHPTVDQVIGYGANGHITSGASLRYAYLFAGTPEPALYTTHSLVLQTILDVGYIGLAALLALVVIAARGLEKSVRESQKSPFAAILAMLAVIFLTGATAPQPSYLFPDTMAVSLLVVGLGMAVTGPSGLRARSEPVERLTHTAPDRGPMLKGRAGTPAKA